LLQVLRTAQIENLFAACTPVLARLYRRLGWCVVMEDACEGADGAVTLIHGKVAGVLRALASTDEEKLLAERELGGLQRAQWEMSQ
jgi:hypothetical protein